MLRDVYTDTICQYNEFEVKPTCGVKRNDFISPIIYNLASESIIRKAEESNRCKICENTA